MKKYELYNDETFGKGYWHGILLIPLEKKQNILSYLQKARENTGYYEPLGIKNVKKKNRVYSAVSAWIQIGLAFLRSKSKDEHYPIDLGRIEEGHRIYEKMPSECIGAKFILFCEKDAHNKMQHYSDHASKVETTFRFALKGGLHFLGNEEKTIEVSKLHFDGHEHYGRNLDKERIVNRLEGLRSYCSISTRSDLIDDRNSDHRKTDSQSYEDCQLLQLTDLLVGGFRTLLGQKTKDLHAELAFPLWQILSRYQKGYARMRNSRWFGSLCISQCYLDNGNWKFSTIEYTGYKNIEQLSLF